MVFHDHQGRADRRRRPDYGRPVVPEITFTPLTDQASELLDRFQAEAQVHPFRTGPDGARSYALTQDTVELDDVGALLDRLAADWRVHLART